MKITKRVVPFLMNRSFFTKIFISISAVSFIGIFSTIIIHHYHFQKVLTDIEMERVQQSINQAALNLDNQLSRIVNDMIYFFGYSGNGEELSSADYSVDVITEDMSKASKELEAFRLRFPGELESVFFFRRDNHTGQEVFLYDNNLNRNLDINYREQEWYHNFEQKIDRSTWTRPTSKHLFYQDRSQSTVWLTKGKYDVDNRDGIFVMRINSKIFRNAFIRLEHSNLIIEVKDSNGELIYSSDPSGAFRDNTNWLHTKSELENTDFIIYAHINKQAINDKVNSIQSIRIVILIFVLIITFLISIVLSLTLVRPVKMMLSLMGRVEVGDFEVRFPSKYSDEIGKLGTGFNKMIANVANLIKEVYVIRLQKMESELRQKEATIMAMQSQINPHFLYNTLEVINCHAIVNNVPSISKMSKALANFFRYSIDKQFIEASLSEEIVHVQTYLEIQNERYQEIEIDVSIPRDYYDFPVIKLTLQPIIENAYQHAFIGDRDYYLKIYVRSVDESTYAIYIEDNGEGMDEERLKMINKRFDTEDPTRTIQFTESGIGNNSSHGIGLNNVHSRIRLKYGERYGVTLLESISGGINVRILLPKEVNV